MKALASALYSSSCLISPQNSPQNIDQTTNITTTILTPKKIPTKSLLSQNPLYSQTHQNLSLQFKEKILCLEILGIDTGKALALNPSLHTASLPSIHDILSFLQSKGIHHKDLPRIFGMCPQILTSNIKTDLNPVFNFLYYDLGVPERSFRKVVNKCPRLLICNVGNQLKPAFFYLKRLGFKDFVSLANNDPVLLVSNVEKVLIPKLEYLINLGFSRDEAIGMVLRCPSLFTFSIENNFKPKLEYFVGEMKGDLEELKEFPQYFAFSLEKRIMPRYLEVMQSGVDVPLSLMLKSTDDEFNQLIGKMQKS
ncbi:transcription termination factor MTEF1, chloroplastic [Silene latifolia]|uniref:transcription termination factor MTEF1, chloroplastic n=1 Tax=Silene latifolia TaxID=37657 RepID=UPI003D775E84